LIKSTQFFHLYFSAALPVGRIVIDGKAIQCQTGYGHPSPTGKGVAGAELLKICKVGCGGGAAAPINARRGGARRAAAPCSKITCLSRHPGSEHPSMSQPTGAHYTIQLGIAVAHKPRGVLSCNVFSHLRLSREGYHSSSIESHICHICHALYTHWISTL
jgi:hypothetical protein